MEAALKPDLINLPWATLLTLASGYAGYYIANVGIRDHHKANDVIFSTLVFGFLAAFVYNACRIIWLSSILWASVAAFLSAIVLGGLWSLAGRAVFERTLRATRVSYSDDLPSAWIALFTEKNIATQLSLKLKDGAWLKCEDLNEFANSPNGPCVLGAKGDVLMYVTHFKSVTANTFEPTSSVIDPEWGQEITYIPADQIVRIDLRRKTR